MRRIYALALCLTLTVGMTLWGVSVGGDEADPVVSRSYLETVFQPQLLQTAESRVSAELTGVYNENLAAMAEKLALSHLAKYSAAPARRLFGKLALNRGDTLLPLAGCKLTLLSGSLSADAALIDVTNGRAAESALAKNTLYMQSDGQSGGLTVTSATAELLVAGAFSLTVGSGPDYGSLADGLSQMGLFRGMTEGYNLEGGTTRAQGLVMFLRLLGKEADALKTKAEIPFADVASSHWAYPYVAYAYENGLTTGVTETEFRPDAAVTAQHYLTFLLRALHYEEGAAFSYDTALQDTVALGLFSQTEVDTMAQGGFLRHKLVYLSYYALFCPDGKTNRLLLEDLLSAGAVTEQNACSGLASARGWRMGEK